MPVALFLVAWLAVGGDPWVVVSRWWKPIATYVAIVTLIVIGSSERIRESTGYIGIYLSLAVTVPLAIFTLYLVYQA